jgi:DNA-directed RNA polymerase omega subunit
MEKTTSNTKNSPEITSETAPSNREGIDKKMLAPDDSVFELVTVAAQRCKQLTNGARPRIISNLFKRKNTSIALEEARSGLVSFTTAEITPK